MEGKLEGPSLSLRVHDPDESFVIQHSVPVPSVLEGLDPAILSRQLSKLLEKVLAPSVPLQVLESQQKTSEDLTDRLVEAGANCCPEGANAGLRVEIAEGGSQECLAKRGHRHIEVGDTEYT
ncbi:hypothetical protein R1flu_008278 [Riccia fluitans]|uniref:Uncharacterized protein n=1 Tax=Riccia fluitans TaxID=41844 RepID=A0ABD1YBG5_9MARC